MNKNPILFSSLVAALATFGFAQEASAIIPLDTFDVDQGFNGTNTETVNESDEGLTNSILGGDRTVNYFEDPNQTGFTGSGVFATGDLATPKNFLNLNTGNLQTSKATLDYDFTALDVTENGSNLGVLFENNSSGTGQVTVSLFSDGGVNSSSATATVPSGTGNIFLDFTSDFTTSGGTGVNLSQVSQAQIILEVTSGGNDVAIDAVGFANNVSVPFEVESGMALVAVGGLIAYRKLRKRGQNQIDS